jgi:hypothetical protein
MITDATDLNVALQQLSQFADTLEAMRLHAESTNSRAFPVLSQAYISRIREINAEIHCYLQAHPVDGPNGVTAGVAVPAPRA